MWWVGLGLFKFNLTVCNTKKASFFCSRWLVKSDLFFKQKVDMLLFLLFLFVCLSYIYIFFFPVCKDDRREGGKNASTSVGLESKWSPPPLVLHSPLICVVTDSEGVRKETKEAKK